MDAWEILVDEEDKEEVWWMIVEPSSDIIKTFQILRLLSRSYEKWQKEKYFSTIWQKFWKNVSI